VGLVVAVGAGEGVAAAGFEVGNTSFVDVGMVVRSWLTAVATSSDEGVAGACWGRLHAANPNRTNMRERNRRMVFIGQLRNECRKDGLPQAEPIRTCDDRARKTDEKNEQYDPTANPGAGHPLPKSKVVLQPVKQPVQEKDFPQAL